MGADFERESDEELVQRTQAGSLEAFEELVYRFEGRLYAFVCHGCRNEADAREVTQETFVRAFQAIGQCNCRRGFAAWLFTIARRKCIDRLRAARPEGPDELEHELAPGHDPAEALARQEEQAALWQLARHELPAVQYQALWLRYAEEMSVAEVAQVLGKTETHVKVLLFRAREALAHRLKAGRAAARAGAAPEGGAGEVLKRAVARCAAGTAEKGIL